MIIFTHKIYTYACRQLVKRSYSAVGRTVECAAAVSQGSTPQRMFFQGFHDPQRNVGQGADRERDAPFGQLTGECLVVQYAAAVVCSLNPKHVYGLPDVLDQALFPGCRQPAGIARMELSRQNHPGEYGVFEVNCLCRRIALPKLWAQQSHETAKSAMSCGAASSKPTTSSIPPS